MLIFVPVYLLKLILVLLEQLFPILYSIIYLTIGGLSNAHIMSLYPLPDAAVDSTRA